MTPSGIEPATFRFVAQHFNHCATAFPIKRKYFLVNLNSDVVSSVKRFLRYPVFVKLVFKTNRKMVKTSWLCDMNRKYSR